MGLEFEALGIAPDRREALAAAIGKGLEADVLLLTGGVSKGEYDYVEEVLEGFGCTFLFDAVAMQPGKPLVAAHHPGGLVFGLPGNPGSVMATFWLFVRPALRRLMGRADGYWHGALAGVLAGPLPGAKNRDRFLPAEVEIAACSGAGPTGRQPRLTRSDGHCRRRSPGARACRSGAGGSGRPCQYLPIGGL